MNTLNKISIQIKMYKNKTNMKYNMNSNNKTCKNQIYLTHNMMGTKVFINN